MSNKSKWIPGLPPPDGRPRYVWLHIDFYMEVTTPSLASFEDK